MSLADQVTQARKSKGLTQEELADKAGVTARTIQRIESGDSIPRTHTIRSVAAALGLGFEDLMQSTPVESDALNRPSVMPADDRDDHEFLQLLCLSCFSYIVIPYLHFLIPRHLLRKNADLGLAAKRFAGIVIRSQVIWVIALNLLLLFSLFTNLLLKQAGYIVYISYMMVVADLYVLNAIIIVFFFIRSRTFGR